MKRTIAIVAGGDTSEFHVSLRSAQGIYSFIDKEKYTLYIVEMQGTRWEVQLPDGAKAPVDRNDFSFMLGTEKIRFDFAYITIHGTPGEDGRLQGYFDMMHIPYSCCGVLAAAITYDKFTCNQYLKAFGVRIAESLLLRQGQSVSDEDVMEKIGLPCFIKPSLGGSSFGVTKVKTKEQIQPAIVKAFEEAQEVLVEAFMEGTELTCGCYKTKDKTVIFPPTEVVTHNEFFDYDAKYNGQVDEITPARISDELTNRVLHRRGPFPGQPGAEARRASGPHCPGPEGRLPAPRRGGLRAFLCGKADRGPECDPHHHGKARQRRVSKCP